MQLKTLWGVCNQIPVYDAPVEMFGEAVFRNKTLPDTCMENRLPMRAKEAILGLNKENLSNPADVKAYWDRISDKYEPAMKVHSFRVLTQVDKLLECNLKLRICQKLKSTR